MRFFVVCTILTVWCISNLEPISDKSFQRREKRIVGGVSLAQNNYYYQAVSYYVYLADGHDCAQPSSWPYHCAKPENLKCGGSLLTPSIVQTSCECLVAFLGPRHQNFTAPCILNNWEKMFLAFLSAKEVEHMTDGYLSLGFYVHEKCAKLAVEPQYLTTHDFGFIKLQKDVKLVGRDLPIRFAPIYSMQNLGKLWTYAINSGVVCMILGHGSYKADPDTGIVSPERSAVLRHSWGVLYNYVECFYLTKVFPDSFNYMNLATWLCMTQIPNDKERSYLAPGDQGSPVACNNHYIGIAAEHIHRVGIQFVLQLAAAIAFNPYENAIEFREDFQKNLKLLVHDPTMRPKFRTVYPLLERGFLKSTNQASVSRARFFLQATAICVMLNRS